MRTAAAAAASARNRFVAGVLQQAGFATLLFDLLTAEEEAVDERTAHLHFDIRLLAERLVGATDWVREHPELGSLPLGYFGASTGAAAALIAAARRPERVAAVVSRGGRPDLAQPVLPTVRTPTLLIVGGRDTPVIGMNRDGPRCGVPRSTSRSCRGPHTSSRSRARSSRLPGSPPTGSPASLSRPP